MTIYSGQNASIYITSLPSVAFTDEGATAGGDLKIFTISDSNKRYWYKGIDVTVERSTDGGANWLNVPDTEYNVQHVGGKIIFPTAQAPGTLIRLDGAYLPFSQLGEAREWSLDIEAEMVDTTTLGNAWKKQQVIQRKASATISKWWLDGFFLNQLDKPLVLVLYVDTATNKSYEAFARLSGDSVKMAVNGMVEEELKLEVDGELFYVG